MGEIFHDKIRFKSVVFKKAQELAAFNFKFKPLVEYLDLATNENLLRDIQPSFFKAVFTLEDIKKRIVPERQILYRFHLDLPKDLQGFSCRNRTKIVTRNAFHIKRLSLQKSVYNHGLERPIVAAIESDERKIERLRSYMQILEILKFDRDDRSGLFLCDSILRMLCRENCRDSDLLRNFLRLVSLPLWLCDADNPEILKYLLLQAIRGRFLKDLWRDLDPQTDIVGLCLISHKIQNMKLLIEYGTVAVNPSESNLYTPGTAGLRDEDPVIYPRVCRTLQLFYYFIFHWHSPEALRFMWQTIKEPFLSRAEIDACLNPMFPPDPVESAVQYYEVSIIKQEVLSSGSTPRRLKDLCRVDIRKFLSDNYQIPFGISRLDIPESLKTYLNLEECLPSEQVASDVEVSYE